MQNAAVAHLDHLFGASVGKALKKHGKLMTPYARDFAKEGAKSKAADFLHAMEVAAQIYLSLGPILEKYDVLICPTTALPAVRADFDPSVHEVRINGKKLTAAPVIAWCMTPPFNMLSRCPVLSVPTGRAKNGVPTGMQIVGRTYSDTDVFRAAMAYETAVGGWYRNSAGRPAL